MFSQGQYDLLTPEQMLAAVEADGKLSYVVCYTDTLAAVCEDDEYNSSSGLLLWVRLDPSSFLYYMNACDESDTNQNVRREEMFPKMNPTKATCSSLLGDAEKGAAFSVARSINKGEQLLHFFPTRASVKRARVVEHADGAAVQAGGSTASPVRTTRSSARTSAGRG